LHEVRLRRAQPDEGRSHDNRPESSTFNLMPPVVLMKGANEGRLAISFRSQKEALSASAWKAAAMVGAGTAITLLGFYML
jgi:hypothetical protein